MERQTHTDRGTKKETQGWREWERVVVVGVEE